MGVILLSKIQIGGETTAGSAVAADVIFRGETSFLDDQREVMMVDENIGYLSKVDRVITPKLLGYATIPFTMNFEQVGHVLCAGVEKVVTGVTDTGGSGKIYTYNMPTTTPNTIQTYTIEGGDNEQAYEMEYSFVDSFTISGAGGEALKMSANWYGRQVTKTTFTTPLSLQAVSDIPFSKGKLFIDAVNGTMGTTQVTNTWLSMNLDVKTGIRPVFTGDGNKYFSFIKNVGPEVTLDLTLEHNSNSVALFDAWQAETAKQIRMVFEGPALTTAGQTYTYKSFIIDFVGKVMKVNTPTNQDGDSVVTVSLTGAYNATCAKFLDFIVVNQDAALT